MEYLWLVQNFIREDGAITIVPAEDEGDANKMAKDINAIANLAVKHKADSFTVMAPSRSSEPVTIVIRFDGSDERMDSFISEFCTM